MKATLKKVNEAITKAIAGKSKVPVRAKVGKVAGSGNGAMHTGKARVAGRAFGNKTHSLVKRPKKAVQAVSSATAAGKAKANGRAPEPVAKSKPQPVAAVETRPNPPPVAAVKPEVNGKNGNAKAQDNGGLAVVTHAGQIKSALKKVERAVAKNSTLPVLSHVLAETRGEDKVKFTATDLNLALWTLIDAHVTSPGAICLPPLLEDLVAQMDDEHLVTLMTNAKASSTTLRVGRRMTRLHVLEASEFPTIGSFNGDTDTVTLGMTHDQLKAVVKQLLPFVSDDDARPVLTGIYLYGKLPEESGQSVKFDLAAADGFRLAHDIYSMPVSFKSRPKVDHLAVIVPGMAWTELAKFIGPDDGKPIHLSFHLKTVKDSDMECGMLQVQTEQGNGLRVNLLEGTFPNYHEVMKEAPEYGIIPLPVKEVANAARGAALLVKKGAGVLRLICDVEHKQVRVEAQDAELGEFSESVPVEWRPEHEPAEGFEIGFNVGKFAEMVRAADYDSDETVVELRVSKNSTPGFVHVGSYTHVLMPMHIGEQKDVSAVKPRDSQSGSAKSKIPNGSDGDDNGKKAEPAPKAQEPEVADTGRGAGNGQADPAAIATIEAKVASFNGNLALAFSQFAGDNLATARQILMKVLTGEERPLAKCGVHALEAAYVAYRKKHPKVEDTRKGAPVPQKETKRVNLVASYGDISLGRVGAGMLNKHGAKPVAKAAPVKSKLAPRKLNSKSKIGANALKAIGKSKSKAR